MGGGSGSNAGDGERRGEADEASLACPPLTSCRAARAPNRLQPVRVRGPRVGDPCSKDFLSDIS